MAQLHGPVLLLLAVAGLVFLFLRNKKKSPFKGQYNYCPGCGSKLKLLSIDGKERCGCKACGRWALQ